jgi:hypothetical protein
MRIAAFGVLGVLATSAAVAQIQDTRILNPRDLRPALRIRETARARCLTKSPRSHHPSALHELPSGGRSYAARRRSTRTLAAGAARRSGPRRRRARLLELHTERNFTLVGVGTSYKSIPGHPRWQLAPVEMAWEGKSTLSARTKRPTRHAFCATMTTHRAIGTILFASKFSFERREAFEGAIPKRRGHVPKSRVCGGGSGHPRACCCHGSNQLKQSHAGARDGCAPERGGKNRVAGSCCWRSRRVGTG